jgi:transposase
MSNSSLPPSSPRFLAADLHKDYLVIGGVGSQLNPVLSPRRIEFSHWWTWAESHLLLSDILVIESTSNAWDFYDQVAPLVSKVVVANPRLVKLISSGRVKTDKVDTMALARLLAANLIPEVWVPPIFVRDARGLLAHRRRLVRNRTMVTNRLQSLLLRHNLPAPDGNPFSLANLPWWETLSVSSTEHLRIRQDLATLDHLSRQILELEGEITRLSTQPPWADLVPFLIQLPGFSIILSMTILAAIGDISRFPSPNKLVAYAGLGASVHDSGKTHRTGKITKTGRRELRWSLVEAAWSAVRYFPYWKGQFDRYARRMPDTKAIVVIARKLLISIWYVLSRQTVDRQADPVRVATKIMCWSWKLSDEQRGGMSSRQFIRYHLMRLNIGQDLTHIRYGNMPRRIASEDAGGALIPKNATALA